MLLQNRLRGSVAYVFLIICVIGSISVVLAYYFQRDKTGAERVNALVRDVTSIGETSNSSSSLEETSVATSPVVDQGSIDNPLSFAGACPDILDESVWSNTVCLEALERHFGGQPAYLLTFGEIMVPRSATFTYKDLFERHESDREFLKEALSHSICLLLDGPIRLDLRDTCNAEAFYRYSLFVTLCHQAESRNWFKPNFRPDGSSRYQFLLHRGTDFEHLQELSGGELSDYFESRNSMREYVLKDIWMISTNQCPRNALHSSNFGLEGEMAIRWQKITDRGKNPLIDISTRLGDERIIIARPHLSELPSDLFESRCEVYPWLCQLEQAISRLPYDYADRLINSARGIEAMREAGYEDDLDRFVTYLCATQYPQLPISKAIEEAEQELDPIDDIGALRVLDEISNTAVKLSLY